MRRIPYILGSLLIIGVIVLSALENKLIFFPTPLSDSQWPQANLDGREVFFDTPDDVRLNGWIVERESSSQWLIYFHGNAGNLADRYPVVTRLVNSLNTNVLIFDYRGYGKSTGRPDGNGVMLDSITAVEWLSKQTGQPPTAFWLLGRSLGGAAATHAAANKGAAALILESTFSSLVDVANVHYPWIPARLIMRQPMDSLETITNYSGPVFQSHGTSDQVVPYEIGQKLHKSIGGQKFFMEFPGLDHNDPNPETYYQELQKFLSEKK